MMGLVTQSDLPTSFAVVQNAQFDGLVQTISLVEGTGIGAIQMSDIVARHGVRAPAADADKHFSAAFVVVSAMPEPDATLDPVVTVQQYWGGDILNGGEMSFALATEQSRDDDDEHRAAAHRRGSGARSPECQAAPLRKATLCHGWRGYPAPRVSCDRFGSKQ